MHSLSLLAVKAFYVSISGDSAWSYHKRSSNNRWDAWHGWCDV